MLKSDFELKPSTSEIQASFYSNANGKFGVHFVDPQYVLSFFVEQY